MHISFPFPRTDPFLTLFFHIAIYILFVGRSYLLYRYCVVVAILISLLPVFLLDDFVFFFFAFHYLSTHNCLLCLSLFVEGLVLEIV